MVDRLDTDDRDDPHGGAAPARIVTMRGPFGGIIVFVTQMLPKVSGGVHC